jgi:hypothetical protein
MNARIHRYASVDGVYHAVLTDPSVRDGHVVVVPTLREVAVVCGSQPVALDGSSRAFPALPDPAAWRRLSRGHYEDDAQLARCVVAGLATDPGEAPTATGAGTFRAVYDRADGFGMATYESEGIAALACQLYGADLITALNNFTRATAAWFSGDYGDTVHTFYKARWCCQVCRAESADRLIRLFPSVSRS